MALKYSVGRKSNGVEDEASLVAAMSRFDGIAAVLRALVVEDQLAYAGWRAAKEAKADAKAMAVATAACIAVPLGIMGACVELLTEAVAIKPRCNPWLVSDLLVCGELATAAVRAGRHNVLANAATDDSRQADVDEADRLLTRAIEAVTRLCSTTDA